MISKVEPGALKWRRRYRSGIRQDLRSLMGVQTTIHLLHRSENYKRRSLEGSYVPNSAAYGTIAISHDEHSTSGSAQNVLLPVAKYKNSNEHNGSVVRQ